MCRGQCSGHDVKFRLQPLSLHSALAARQCRDRGASAPVAPVPTAARRGLRTYKYTAWRCRGFLDVGIVVQQGREREREREKEKRLTMKPTGRRRLGFKLRSCMCDGAVTGGIIFMYLIQFWLEPGEVHPCTPSSASSSAKCSTAHQHQLPHSPFVSLADPAERSDA